MPNNKKAQSIIAGIDVGGTFTDLLLVADDGVKVVKTPAFVCFNR